MLHLFGSCDLDLLRLPRAQLVQLVWRMLERDPDLALCPSTVGLALDLLGRDFDNLEPTLYSELLTRLYREHDRRWLAYRSLPIPAKSWRTTMSPIHSAIYRACYPSVTWIDLDFMQKLVISRQTIEDLHVDILRQQTTLEQMAKERASLLALDPEIDTAIARERSHDQLTGPQLAALGTQKQNDNRKTQELLTQLHQLRSPDHERPRRRTDHQR